MIIIGCDPGNAITGYAIIKIKSKGDKPKVLDFGCILTKSSESQGERLRTIHIEFNKLINKYKPDLISVENLYFFKNLKTAIPVSQAKGVILLAAAGKKIPIYEFTPLQVKMAVVGYGRAEKKQVQKMIKEVLDLSGFSLNEKDRKKDDATDALGIALCGFLKVINKANG
jgi:crossover junction endodeoxyribonuclease RuvC